MKTRQQWLQQIEWNGKECRNGVECAYVIELYKGETRRWLKVGYSRLIENRMLDHLKNKKYDIDRVEVLEVFTFTNEDSAQSMENTLRRYFKEKGNGVDYIPRDRFNLTECTRDDLLILGAKAQMVEAL